MLEYNLEMDKIDNLHILVLKKKKMPIKHNSTLIIRIFIRIK